ncbi:MAG: tRNA dihydrouridine synthase DusB [Alphaproteobacteria bacterium]
MSLFIGSLELNDKIMVAPMAGVTDRPFRIMVRKFSKALLFTEMIAANSIVRSHKKTINRAKTYQDEYPIAVQIVGNDPETIAEAAKMSEASGASLIDINMGCPVRKLITNISGAALMKDAARVGAIVKAARNAINIPLTVKIRSGWDEKNINAPEIAHIAESEGADAVIVHGRTREQMYSGIANLDVIAAVKNKLSIPVIGNGDIYSSQDAMNMISKTNCNGVMIGRGILGRPWAVSDISKALNEGELFAKPEFSNEEKRKIVLEHYDEILQYYGIRNGIKIARKHICWYSRNFKNATEFRERFNLITSLDIAKNMINEFFI